MFYLTKLLVKLFVKDSDNCDNPKVRTAYGNLSGVCGIILNLLLFGGKLFAGIISASVSVIADALNNLSDAGSSVVTFLGFKFHIPSQFCIHTPGNHFTNQQNNMKANAGEEKYYPQANGEMHYVFVSKLKNKYKIDVDLDKPIVPYREKIRTKVQARGKKQGSIWRKI